MHRAGSRRRHQNPRHYALQTALAWAKAIGCTRAGAIKTTFRELVYFECLHELKFIVDLIHEEGIAGMHSLISDTVSWGDPRSDPGLSIGTRAKTSQWRCEEFAAATLRGNLSGK